jgi:hypothetical protein
MSDRDSGFAVIAVAVGLALTLASSASAWGADSAIQSPRRRGAATSPRRAIEIRGLSRPARRAAARPPTS